MNKQHEVAKEIYKQFPKLSESQLEIIGHIYGPLLVVAGPGSGKTLVLVMRALNLLLLNLARPKEILICTFTEKAAFELRDRISEAAKKMGYFGDLSELRLGTIHSICNEFLRRNRHHTPLGNNYEVLDDLTQLLFLFEHFNEVIGSKIGGRYLGRWKTKWTAIRGAQRYFNKITEELIDTETLVVSDDLFLQKVGAAYQTYECKMYEKNRIDYAHQEKLFFNILCDPPIGESIIKDVKYVMVDEYQDTNYVQEKILLELARPQNNICVVGDEDQSLYRFRGATVRNILEFPRNFNSCDIKKLETNYRSHKDIVEAYNKFMDSCDWKNPDSSFDFRYEKIITPDPQGVFPEYPAIFSIWGVSKKDEAKRLADTIHFLKKNRVIEDYSQIAIFLHSVRRRHSGHYLKALDDRGIPVFCPRARSYFANEEVRYMVACFGVLLGYYGKGRGDLSSGALMGLARYVDSCISDLGRNFSDPHPLARAIQKSEVEIRNLKKGATLDRRLADYFYSFLAYEPFVSMVKDENRARNLAIFSQLLNTFQNYYHYTVISHRNRDFLRLHFFNSFLRLLYIGGINEYEDPFQPIPKGYVQVMTVHQSKGLEFPVVFVNSLDQQLSSSKDVDRHLARYYRRETFEPENKITTFDRMRFYYVAFSRAKKILVLTSTNRPKPHLNSIWQGLLQWPYVRKDLLQALFFRLRNRIPIKKAFSFTSDLKVYETCPRQYEFFRHYNFAPSRSAEIFFGALVHQTIEDIHHLVMEGRSAELEEKKIREMFDLNFHRLAALGLRQIGKKQRETAFSHVMNYFRQNQPEMDRIVDTEVDVSVEKDRYILAGKIDLLLGLDNKLKLLDFKSQPRPQEDDERLDCYYKQLCIYAYILEQRYNKKPERLILYWTGEPLKKDALMEFPYKPDMVSGAGNYFEQVVERILEKKFKIYKPPEPKVCNECDLRLFCGRQGIIKLRGGAFEE